MEVYSIAVLSILLLVCLYTGILHVSRRLVCRREEGMHRFDKTSNGKLGYRIPVYKITKGGRRVRRLECRFPKEAPVRGEVLYLEAGEARTSALVTAVGLQDNTEAGSEITAEVSLFGAHALPAGKPLMLTNRRLDSQLIAPKTGAPAWPVIVRRRRSTLIFPAVILFFTLLTGVGLVMDAILGGADVRNIYLAVCLLLVAAGTCYRLLDCLRFRIMVTRDWQAELRSAFSTRHYHMQNLDCRMVKLSGAGSRQAIRLQYGGRNIALALEQDPGFDDLLQVIRLSSVQKQRDRLLDTLAQVGEDLYVPLLPGSGGEGSMLGQLMVRRDGAKAYAAYETMELMQQQLQKQHQSGASCVGVNTSLQELVTATRNFELAQAIIIFLKPRQGMPAVVEIGPDVWKSLQGRRKHE